MIYGSLFSGIESPGVAWRSLGWSCAWTAEVDPFASAVLAHHFPEVPNLGDVTLVNWDAVEPVELVVFGSPCQSFSVAGNRAGLDDPRGNMALIGLRAVDRIRPRWLVFENVTGLLSSDEWRDFGTFLGALGECGYGFAYRVLDAQHFGVPQRRRRVFVIGYLGDWRPAAAVLFERNCLSWNSPPSREAGQGVTPILEAGARTGKSTTDPRAGIGIGEPGDPQFTLQSGKQHAIAFGIDSDCFDRTGEGYGATPGARSGLGIQEELSSALRSKRPNAVAFGGNNTAGAIEVSTAINAHGGPHGRLDFETETFVLPVMAAGAHGANGAGIGVDGDKMFTLDRTGAHAIAFAENSRAELRLHGGDGQTTGSLKVGGGKAGQSYPAVDMVKSDHAIQGRPFSVRRLTPREAERLQGFPDDYTAIRYNGKPAADGPRYRALGNAMAVPVIRWIGERIGMFAEIAAE